MIVDLEISSTWLYTIVVTSLKELHRLFRFDCLPLAWRSILWIYITLLEPCKPEFDGSRAVAVRRTQNDLQT